MSDPLAVIEAAYEVRTDESGWLTQLCEAQLRALGLESGEGVFAYVYDARNPVDVRLGEAVSIGLSQDLRRGLEWAINLPGAFSAVMARTMVGTMSTDLGPAFEPVASKLLRPFDQADGIGITATDSTRIGLVLCAIVRRQTRLSPAQLRLWRRVAAHLAAGYRIQRALAGLVGEEEVPMEAVLTPGGKLEHAEAPAASALARAELRRAVKALDDARSKLRKTDPAHAVETWKGLVAGRWSLVDRFDRDGRHYILARRNDPCADRIAGLTTRQCQVVRHAALGHANKLIAYELGLSPSSVVRHLRKAAAVLGVDSRVALIRAAAMLGLPRHSEPPDPS